VEDRDHVFFFCPAAQAIWNKIGLPHLSFGLGDLWTTSRNYLLSNANCAFAMISILYRIWDAMNSLVFRQQNIPCNLVISRIMMTFKPCYWF
jgi:hypothetical protein